MKLHEPKQLTNQTPGGSVQTPGRGKFMLQTEHAYQIIWMEFLKKTNRGETQAF